MNARFTTALALLGVVSVWAAAGPGEARVQDPPKIQIPQSGVPEILVMEGKFVRAAYNNEGYVILGYQLANRSLGEPWMLLEVGVTVRDGVPNYEFNRSAVSLETPGRQDHPAAVRRGTSQGRHPGAAAGGKVQRDSINYFPPSATRACGLTFFPDLEARVLPVDHVELSSQRACVGRFYFNIPGGIAYGQHWLNVKFEKSLIRVPFRILTAEEEKTLSKNYGSISKQVKDAFKPKKK